MASVSSNLDFFSSTFLLPAAGFIALLVFRSQFGRSSSAPNQPPLVPYLVPWLGSAVSMGKDPDTFFTQAREKYGNIFAVQAAGAKQYFVTSAADIASVYKNSKSFVFMPTRKDICEAAFGTSHAAVFGDYMETMFAMHHKVLAQSNVGIFTQALTRHGLRIISGLKDSVAEKEIFHTTLEAFVHPLVFEAQSAAMFGSSFPAMSLYQTFLEFDGTWFPLMVAKFPRFLLKKGVALRDKITLAFNDYLNHPTSEDQAIEFRNVHTAGVTGATPPWSQYDAATNFMGGFWAAESNMTWAVYWLLAYPLYQPGGFSALIEELNKARHDWLEDHPSANLLSNSDDLHDFVVTANLPLMEAYLSETLRITSSSFSIRTVAVDEVSLGGYDFQKGDIIVCNTRAVHQDEAVYADPGVFKPERFLQPGGVEATNQSRKPFLAFGGGVSQCEGRHFAVRGAKILIALFLTHFDIQLDPGKPSRIDLDMTRIGLGILHPKTPTHILVKRKKWA